VALALGLSLATEQVMSALFFARTIGHGAGPSMPGADFKQRGAAAGPRR
jgi:hypothetical protein